MSLLFIQWHRQIFVHFPSFIHHTFLSKFHNATILWYIFACGTCFFMEAVAKYFHTILCFRVLTFALINQFTHYCRELRLTSAQIIPGCVIHTGYACASFILSMGLKVNKNNTYICRWFFSDLRYILDCLTKNAHPKCQLYSWYHSYLYHESMF